MDVEEAWDNSVVASLADALEATRFGRVLAQAFREARPSSQYTHLADWEAEYKKFSDLPWSDTIKIWSAYEENLRYMGRLAQAQGVPMLLCTPVWNRLSSPRVDTPPPGLTSEVIDQARRLHRRARKHYPAPLTELLPRKEQQRVHLFNWGGPGKVFKDGRLQEPLPELRPSLGWLADQDPKLYMEREWHPKVRAWYASLSWLYGSRTAEEEKSLHRAAKLLEEGLEILPESAILRFDMAMVRYAAGERGPDIRAAFEEAARLDRAPRKANPHSNERVHRVAAELEGVHLFDADKRFAEGSPDGLVGWEWMTDHCHLSHGAGGALLRDIADEVAGLVQGDPR
jgi:hypothetical protein